VNVAAVPARTARIHRATTSSRVFTVIAVAIVAWMVTLTRGDSAATHNKLVELCVLVVLASMWNLLAGYSGLVSVGQQAFVGIGAYTLIVFRNGLDWNIYAAALPAGVVALLLAVPIGFVAFRLRGAYFAVGTWVIAEVVKLLITNNKGDVIRGGSGTSLDAPASVYPPLERSQTTSLIAVALAVAAVVAVYLVLRSRLGLVLQAIRDDEAGARGLGTDVYRSRFTVWLLAAAFTGLAGAVNYLQALRVQPESAFSVAAWTAPIIVMVVVGGIGTVEGPIIGAVVWFVAKDYLTDDRSRIHVSTETYLIASGLVAVLCALYLRGGVWGALTHRFPHLQLFPLRRRLGAEEVT
jgi:branched-chain amino acid transport system permease protein